MYICLGELLVVNIRLVIENQAVVLSPFVCTLILKVKKTNRRKFVNIINHIKNWLDIFLSGHRWMLENRAQNQYRLILIYNMYWVVFKRSGSFLI